VKRWYLKLHRWIALLFALPLIVIIATGLILSVEPWLVDRAVKPGQLSVDRIDALLTQHDPRHQARALSYRSYDGALTMSSGRRGGTTVNVATGETMPRQSTIASVLMAARRLHETLLLDARWLVVASTAAMLVVCVIGMLMGWPRFANSLAGWHKAVAWTLLPLIILSPLTALLMSMGVTFGGFPRAGGSGTSMSLSQAVHTLAQSHDLSGLLWIRPQGRQYIARVDEGGEFRVYAVRADGLIAAPRNWPRLWHEGDFAGAWSSLMNIVISVALLTLLGTGVWIWGRRTLQRRKLRGANATPNAGATRV
jgi:uncharacterized iron-regulated membrane protein